MIKKIILKAIRFYQKTDFFHNQLFKTFFLTDKVCKFSPTCSEYTYQAIKKYNTFKGLWLGLKRIIHCHPWAKGGYDPLK